MATYKQQFRTKWAVLAALGAGCLAGMSGVLLIQRLSKRIENTTSQSLTVELASLHSTIKELQLEIRQIKRSPPISKSTLRSVTFSDVDESFRLKNEQGSLSAVSSRSSITEYFSAMSSDDDDFYDLPTDQEDEDGLRTPTNETINFANKVSVEQVVDDQRRHFFRKIDEFQEGCSQRQNRAFELLQEKEKKREMSEDSEFMWRLCKALYLKAVVLGQEGRFEEKRASIFRAVDYGSKAVDLDDNSSEAHKWYAIVVGSRGEYLPIKDKISDGYVFKRHIDRASELSPHDHTIKHLLGRFCYEIAGLSWWERKVASSLFGEPPCATMEEAKDHFMSAEELKPDGWKENRQFLAKTFIQLGDYKAALHWLDRANALPVNNPDDQQAQTEIGELLASYNKYR